MTCEEYVVSKLTALEEENENLTNNLDALKAAYDRLENKLADIRRIIESRASVRQLAEGGTLYISIDSIWKRSWDDKEFDDYHKFLGYFNIPSEVEEEKGDTEDGKEE